MRKIGPAVINSAALALSSGTNFVALFLWTRLLSPAAFGSYALLSATALLVNALLFEWLRLVAARTLYDPVATTGISLARGDALLAIVSTVSAALVAVGVVLWLADIRVLGLDPKCIPLVVAFSLTEMGLAIVNTVSRVRLMSWQFFRSMVARSALSIIVGLVLVVRFHWGATGVIAGVIASQGLVVGASLLLDPLWRGFRIGRASRAEIRNLIAFGYPLIASSAFTFGVGVVDRYLVGAVLGARAVGFYAAPADLLQKTVVFAMLAINLTAYPTLVRAYEDSGPAAARRLLENNFLLQFALGLPAAVCFAVLAPGLAALLLGPTFRDVGVRLLPFVGATALVRCAISYHLAMVFNVTNRTKLMVMPPIVALTALVPFGLIGLRLAGIEGMAIASLLAQALSYAVTAVLAKRVFRFTLLSRDAIKVTAAGLVMAVVLLPFARHATVGWTLGALLIGAASYGLALLAFGIEAVRLPFHPIRAALMKHIKG
jgi:O-antigen/teichoic acid export membrane protein